MEWCIMTSIIITTIRWVLLLLAIRLLPQVQLYTIPCIRHIPLTVELALGLVSAFTISRLLLRQVSDLTLRRAITFLYHQVVLLRPSRGLVLIVSQTSLVLVLVSTSTSVLDFDHLKRHPWQLLRNPLRCAPAQSRPLRITTTIITITTCTFSRAIPQRRRISMDRLVPWWTLATWRLVVPDNPLSTVFMALQLNYTCRAICRFQLNFVFFFFFFNSCSFSIDLLAKNNVFKCLHMHTFGLCKM